MFGSVFKLFGKKAVASAEDEEDADLASLSRGRQVTSASEDGESVGRPNTAGTTDA